jgi:lipid II:glycine glycyltransferase (peptidoglycan interpeptide bridge formation enzyme)
MRPATGAEISAWDDLVVGNPDGGHILQSRAWGEFKRQHGWTPRYLVSERGGGMVAILVLQRLIPGLGSLWYAPKGPGVSDPLQLRDVLRGAPTSGAAFCLKIEPELDDDDAVRTALQGLGLRKARHDVQISRATIIVDLRPDETQLLASFKPKTRYNIRLAARRGVTVRPVHLDGDSLDTMYRLMAATRDRAGFTLRSKEYFAGYWRLHEAAGQGQLFLADWQGTTLAGVFATFMGRKAWYKDGGSVKEHADVMAPHLLQWEVMRWLRERGAESYDLVAVPRRAQLSTEHPLHGLYRFKSGFSDHITEFAGTWDLPLHRLRYALWDRAGERAAHQLAYRVRHDLFY